MRKIILFVLFVVSSTSWVFSNVPLYKIFEKTVINDNSYGNKFRDVTLNVSYLSPSGRQVDFWGFFDGDGNGGGHKSSGNVWKMRFMPDELGQWSYSYRWTDGTPGGNGTFMCQEEGRGKGILRAYQDNPRWLAYNGTDPVFIKSYYVKPHGSITQPISWMGPNVYQRALDRGYNHLQIAGLLPIGYMDQSFTDGPSQLDKIMIVENDPYDQVLDVWERMETHFDWWLAHDMNVHFFQGFHGKKQFKVRYDIMSNAEKDFYLRYVMSRLAPYAVVAGWNYTWETKGNGKDADFAARLAQFDPWDHLRSYHDARPDENFYDNPNYTFAPTEDHGLDSHDGSLSAYKGKPVFMSEGNDLWRSCWNAREYQIQQHCWWVTTAGASFTWNDLPSCNDNVSTDMFSWSGATQTIDNLFNIMENMVTFYTMEPHDDLLSGEQDHTYCLAEPGKQYLVYEDGGGSFEITLFSGSYQATWLDANNLSNRQEFNFISGGGSRNFTTPNTDTNWILLLINESEVPSVQLISPNNGDLFSPGDNIAFEATATIDEGSIALVEFYANDNKLGEDITSPYEWIWTDVEEGNYEITAVATANSGVRSSSSVTSIAVVAPPVFSSVQVSPSGTTMAPGATLSLNAMAMDQYGNALAVQPEFSWSLIGEGVLNGNSYTAPLFEGGTYTISAEASVDDLSHTGTSEITVSLSSDLFATVNATTGLVYEIERTPVEGTLYYTDRPYMITSLPAVLTNSELIRTPNEDKANVSGNLVSFDIISDATIYVGYDSRYAALPDWMADWETVGEVVETSDKDSDFVLFKKDYNAGMVSVGGNLSGGAVGAATNYILFGSRKIFVDSVKVSGLSLNVTTLSIDAGSSEQLEAQITPFNATNQAVTWLSSNPEVATVDAQGFVFGMAAGMSTISAVTQDGGYVAECQVTVHQVNIPVTGVTIESDEINIFETQCIPVVATVLPSNASNQSVSWASADETVATVDDFGLLCAQNIGSTTLTVTTNDGAFTYVTDVNVLPQPQNYLVSASSVSGRTYEVVNSFTVGSRFRTDRNHVLERVPTALMNSEMIL